jgi:hypothetical protein
MVYLALEFCRHARFLGVAACVKSWGPFLVLFPLAVRLRVAFSPKPPPLPRTHTQPMASLNRVTQHSTYSCEGTTSPWPPSTG